MNKRTICLNKAWMCVLLFGAVLLCIAQETQSDFDNKLKISGHAGFSVGVAVSCKYRDQEDIDYSGAYLPNAGASLTISKKVRPFLEVVAGLDGELWDSFHKEILHPWLQTSVAGAIMGEAKGIFTADILENHRLKLCLGHFNFKYNPEATNLGEYMFRTTTYPQTIVTSFDFPLARLLGLNLNYTINGTSGLNFKNDILLTSETRLHPMWDWSLTWIGSTNFKEMVEIGAGVMFDRLIPVDRLYTEASSSKDKRYTGDGSTSGKNGYIENVRPVKNAAGLDSLDPFTGEMVMTGDTGYVPFSGTKIMARASIDPKRIFMPPGENGIFGENDLKIYGEMILLGVKNYPAVLNFSQSFPDTLYAYDNRANRLSKMVGIMFPTFKLLDVLAIEIQHWSNPYPNSLEDVNRQGEPSPGVITDGRWDLTNMYREDDWKWSVYARKTLFGSFQLFFMVARDHIFPRNYGFNSTVTGFNELLRTKEDWWWTTKLQFLF